MDEQKLKEIALVRYGKSAPLVNDTIEMQSKSAYFRSLAKTPCQLLDGRKINCSAGTYKSWYLGFLKGGFDALYPKTRADNGKSRTPDHEAIRRIYELKEKYLHITTIMIYEKKFFLRTSFHRA